MTIPDHELPGSLNGSRIHLGTLKWGTAFVLLLLGSVAFLAWLAWANSREWESARLSQRDISARVSEDRLKMNLHQARLLNELKLQTFNQMLPAADQRALLPTLLSRLDDDTQKTVTSLRLRGLMGTGEQQSQTLSPQRRQAP